MPIPQKEAPHLPPYAPLDRYVRRTTRPVRIRTIDLGGSAPIRVQSMTTTRGKDIQACIQQSQELIAAGAELVRITAPTIDDARALKEVVASLHHAALEVPIVADIHFSPPAALEAAKWVDKVRINPGNYSNKQATATQTEYEAALHEIQTRLAPLLDLCKQRNVAIRIGVNHGSLAPRIVERYGAGAEGMVQSAIEFIEICRRLAFHNIVLSLKASSPKIMVQANRLLVANLLAKGYDYPIHLGVTEAGEGEDGRIKSAIGIGALLIDGIGDTIRVSLTEAPTAELPVCRDIIATVEQLAQKQAPYPCAQIPYDPYHASRRPISRPEALKECIPGIIATQLPSEITAADPKLLTALGFTHSADGQWIPGDRAFSITLCHNTFNASSVPQPLQAHFALPLDNSSLKGWRAIDGSWQAVTMTPQQCHATTSIEYLIQHPDTLLFIHQSTPNIYELRMACCALIVAKVQNPIVLQCSDLNGLSGVSPTVAHALYYGALLVDNLAEGIAIAPLQGDFAATRNLGLAILQDADIRRTRADFISCPSCGRTLFDIAETVQHIKTATAHLKNLKIGVMGCIVNGPGEMADADYGYVGAGAHTITLYKGNKPVRKNIPQAEALPALINLIKEGGDWIDPSA